MYLRSMYKNRALALKLTRSQIIHTCRLGKVGRGRNKTNRGSNGGATRALIGVEGAERR